MAMLTGEYFHQLDAKNRMRIPARLKKELGDEYYFAKGSNRCIYVFPKDALEETVKEFQEIKFTDLSKQKSLRMFSKSIVLAEEDNQGRFVLPPKLREYAGIGQEDKDLVICGVMSRVEIWSRKVYDEYFKDEDEEYDKYLSMLGNEEE